MVKLFDINEQGFSIRCIYYCGKDPKAVTDIVVATYGFGGNKENKATEKFAERLTSKYKNFGVVCFDWPCHGADARNKLILPEALTYYEIVNNYVKREMGAERIYAYGTSLGGYLTLQYLHDKGCPFERIALRCPAIGLYEIMTRDLTDDDWTKLKRGKEVIKGYTRKIKLGLDYFEQLQKWDVREYEYFDYAENMLIIHGTKDEFISVDEVTQFAEDNVIELNIVEKADHPFSDPHIMDTAIASIIDFFKPQA